ncbi:dihydrofolate reductase family protein [Sphingosinicella terrae]|uniref:dihydrofolate reductase family protein n=1 Tax=Sphingosinicella terrae TaxID=2172047 RepID=UPI000E0D7208|nr:dihydrofolate reductase family protein [Sphingosinicella terrae]
MRKIIGAVFVSLDGVMQAPGGPDEDRSGGFELGGWLAPFWDEESDAGLGNLFASPFDLLLGRRTYDIFAAYWPYVTGEAKTIGEQFDRARKYVVTGSDRPLDWQNSHRLAGIDAIAELKQGEGPDLVIQGSSTLYPPLLSAGLMDRLILRTFPVILDRGKRWFGENMAPGAMRMVEHQVTPGGNIIATYEPGGKIEPGSFVTDEPTPAELRRREKVKEGTW